MQDAEERRELTRMPFTPRAYCQLKKNGKEFAGTIRDISLASLFLKLDHQADISGDCDIQIVLEGKHSELEINNLGGRVVRSDNGGVAIHFDKPLEWFSLVPLYFRKLAG